MNKLVTRINWVNDTDPAINDTHLNQMDSELDAIDDRVIGLEGACETQAEEAEAWAVGERGGEAVQSGDPTYHNNSKYYSQQASNSATNAGTSETNAGNSATAAGNSATAAGNSALVSEGWAKGTQNGTPVASGSPYYENNAEWFKNQAQQIASQTIGGLSDVTINAPTNGQVLTYDSDNNIWRNTDGGSVETKSGNPLAITTDSAQVARSTIITLNPIQAAGTPTPSNSLPISGYDSVELIGYGKNLCPHIKNTTWSQVTTTTNSSGVTTVSGTSSNAGGRLNLCTEQFWLPAGTYTISHNGTGTWGETLVVTNIDTSTIYQCAKNVSSNTFTLSSGANVVLGINLNNATVYNGTVSPQLELGSTATTYEPYQQSNNLAIPLPETVYGGVPDVESGVLTVNMAMVDMGDLTWTYNASHTYFNSSLLNPVAKAPAYNWAVMTGNKCSCYKTVAYQGIYIEFENKACAIHPTGLDTELWARDTDYTDAATFKTAVTGQKLVYELANPYTIQLTPQQIALLEGSNVFTTSNGATISVTYRTGEIATLEDVETANRQMDAKIRPITVNTEVGNPITFTTDSVQTAIGTSVVLEPIQASGTPTPSNPLPISGYNNIEVKVPWGKNLFNPSNLIKGTFSDTQFNVTNVGSTVYRSYKAYLPKGNYTISFDKTVDVIATIKDGVFSSSAEVYTSKTYTLVNDGWFGLSWCDNTSSSTNWDDTAPIQLELGLTATAYSPFSLVTDINMYLPNTVYGGNYNVEYGILTVTPGIVDMGDLEWTYNSVSAFFEATITGCVSHPTTASGKKPICSVYSSHVPDYVSNLGNREIMYRLSGAGIYVKDSSYTDVATFKTAVTGQKIVYELATPYNLQLTPQQVHLPSTKNQGGRVMWTNGTAISMTYRKGEMASLWNTFQLGAALNQVAVQTFSGMVSAQRISTGTFQGHVNADAASMANLGAAQVRNIYFSDTEVVIGSVSNDPEGTLRITYR